MNPPEALSGTKPPATRGEAQAAARVERMFASIAGRYDLLNHLLSFNIDRGWRNALLREIQAELAGRNAIVLDLCCGTGDVLADMIRKGNARVVGVDFCHPMLLRARRKLPTPALVEADALQMPVPSGTFDAIAIAFGFRNLANYRNGLAELFRVLKPGGRVAILEFSHPNNVLVRLVYGLYLRVILPLAGGLISGSLKAYSYLPASIRKFPRAQALAEMMEQAGFAQARYRLLTFGIAALHVAIKPVSALRTSSGD
jgi:demethylmenaquinone methyltransferase/2-methoxy-6-polyprenyl-1,4-benzoquinol methylase